MTSDDLPIAELDVLRSTWFPIATEDEIKTNTVLRAQLLGESIVIFSHDESITVALARCPHRGADLSDGTVTDRGLVCPYHGWEFEPVTGRCLLIPSVAPDSAATPSRKAALDVLPSQVRFGHVWACLSVPFEPLPDLADAELIEWIFSTGPGAVYESGMRQLTENFLDTSHFPFVHTGTMGPNVERTVEPYTVSKSDRGIEWTITTDLGGNALNGNTALSRSQTLTYHVDPPNFAWIRTVFPDGGRRLLGQFASPINDSCTRIRLFWVLGVDSVVRDRHNVSIEEMREYEHRIFEEDRTIVEKQYPRESPLDPACQAHTKADSYSVAYRRAYQAMIDRFRAGSF